MSKLYEEIRIEIDSLGGDPSERDLDSRSKAIEKICIKEVHLILQKLKEAPKEQWERMVNVGLEELQKQL